jgi:hypothetical protein
MIQLQNDKEARQEQKTPVKPSQRLKKDSSCTIA